jgi:hypothetical protein
LTARAPKRPRREGCGFHRQRRHNGRGEKHFGEIPAGQAGLMGFDYIPLGPLSPLRIINDMVK